MHRAAESTDGKEREIKRARKTQKESVATPRAAVSSSTRHHARSCGRSREQRHAGADLDLDGSKRTSEQASSAQVHVDKWRTPGSDEAQAGAPETTLEIGADIQSKSQPQSQDERWTGLIPIRATNRRGEWAGVTHTAAPRDTGTSDAAAATPDRQKDHILTETGCLRGDTGGGVQAFERIRVSCDRAFPDQAQFTRRCTLLAPRPSEEAHARSTQTTDACTRFCINTAERQGRGCA